MSHRTQGASKNDKGGKVARSDGYDRAKRGTGSDHRDCMFAQTSAEGVNDFFPIQTNA